MPNDLFFMDFETFLAPIFHEIFDFFRKHRKSENHAPVHTGIRKKMFRHLKKHPFSNDFSIKFSCFFWNPSWIDFFSIFGRFWTKKGDFGPLLGSSWGPKSTLGATFSAQKSTFELPGYPGKRSWSRPGAQKPPKMTPGTPRAPFLSIFERF